MANSWRLLISYLVTQLMDRLPWERVTESRSVADQWLWNTTLLLLCWDKEPWWKAHFQISLRSSFSRAVNLSWSKSSASFLILVRESFSPFEQFPKVSKWTTVLLILELHPFILVVTVLSSQSSTPLTGVEITLCVMVFVPCQVVDSQKAVQPLWWLATSILPHQCRLLTTGVPFYDKIHQFLGSNLAPYYSQ